MSDSYTVIVGSRVISLFALLLGTGILGFVVISITSNLIFLSQSISTEGTVTGFGQDVARRPGDSVVYPQVRFTTGTGQVIEFQPESVSATGEYRVGQTVKVIYDPAHPDNARIDDAWNLWFQFICLLFGGVGFLTCAVIGFLIGRRQEQIH
jgi:hypothetical protein